jgi:hypothetical protein
MLGGQDGALGDSIYPQNTDFRQVHKDAFQEPKGGGNLVQEIGFVV